MTLIEADLTWLDGRFQSGIKLSVDDTGRIVDVGDVPGPVTVRLVNRAILPGFVNAHSHAFQRGLRGRGESYPIEAGSFWTWREAMYALVQEMDRPRFLEICEQAFREMLASGITSVGEFHYLHHTGASFDYGFDELVLQAAASSGIRIVLLNTYYETRGINQPLSVAQQQFFSPSLAAFWHNVESLHEKLQPERQSLGVAAHSIRAVPIETVRALHAEATRRELPFHMHLEEQPQEIEACVAAYGTTPMALLNRELESPGNLTAIHCTHSQAADVEVFLESQRGVCLCPLTEASLGDGIPASVVSRENTRMSLGTDSNTRISVLEEMRWLEYGQRLRYEKRGAVTDPTGDVATRLIEIATSGGAAALGLDAGTLRRGAHADLISVDLDHPSLRFAEADSLGAALVFGCDRDVIDRVCVGGVWHEITSGRLHDAR